MKRLLMATAAAIALAVAAPLATAQYTTPPPATAPYTTPLPDDPLTPQDESLSSQQQTTQNPPMTSTQPLDAQAQVGVEAQTGVQPQPYGAQAQTGVQTQTYGQTQPYDTQAPAQAQTYGDTQPYGAQAPGATGQAQTQTYGSQTYADQSTMGGASMNAALEQHARDAGMERLPMTAMEVCAPREISLTTRGTQLTQDKRRQLINATDRASVCEIQRVVINSPSGRADSVRQTLVSHGVDASMIDVQQADTGGVEVEMHFAGVATSSEQYAQMFNQQQYAGYQPGASPSSAQPYNAAPGSSYQPNSMSPSTSDGVWLGDPNVEVPQNPTNEGWSPTSGEGAERPDLYDI